MKYYVCVLVEEEKSIKEKLTTIVGIDLGIRVILSVK